jgi:hypothetical protein
LVQTAAEISPALRRGGAAVVKCFKHTIRQARCNGRKNTVRGLSEVLIRGLGQQKVVNCGVAVVGGPCCHWLRAGIALYLLPVDPGFRHGATRVLSSQGLQTPLD